MFLANETISYKELSEISTLMPLGVGEQVRRVEFNLKRN